MLSFVVVGLVAAEAPITQVTVYSDQARVVRSMTRAIAGEQTVELATLPASVEESSIRVEVTGGELRRVLLEWVAPEQFTTEAARSVLTELERLDTELDRLTRQRASLERQRDALLAVSTKSPETEPTRPAPKLAATGWLAGQAFLAQYAASVQRRARETAELLEEAQRSRAQVLERAQRLGGAAPRAGWKVSALVSGSGVATLRCTYLVPQARWTPTWDLQLAPEQNLVTLSLAGVVHQETTEDWSNVALELSTATPSSAVKAPELERWTIGIADRFIPRARPVAAKRAAAPPAVPMRTSSSEAEALRAQLDRLLPHEASKPTLAAAMPNLRSAPASSVVTGTVTDADSGRPIQEVVTTVSSPGNREIAAVTDAAGTYRLVVPAGTSTLRFEHSDYRPFERSEITVRTDRTVRLNVQLQRNDSSNVMSVDGISTTADVGSTSVGLGVGKDFINNVAFIQPDGSGVRSFESLASVAAPAGRPMREVDVSLSPPPSWRPPRLGADAPLTLADGTDLTFAASGNQRLPSSGGERRVPLWAGQWPVTLERHLYPGLSSAAYLVAQLRNPTQRVLPGGPAHLMVGADPAGEARLAALNPGEVLTLPLGVDKALTPIRTLRLVQGTTGLFGTSTQGTYTVTIELANPHPTSVVVRVFDQWPLSTQSEVQTRLIETAPEAKRDDATGWLDWSATLPPGAKTQFSFTYRISRPDGWRLAGREETP